MASVKQTETRQGVELTNLDQPLFGGAEASKRDLIDYLEAVADPLLAELRDRPLSVLRVRPGQRPFMQKNLPAERAQALLDKLNARRPAAAMAATPSAEAGTATD